MRLLQEGNLYALPALPYTMEFAALVRLAVDLVKPDCIAVELPEALQEEWLYGVARLPDLTILRTRARPFLIEPCDGFFEALRLAQERAIPGFAIGRASTPHASLTLPDPYAMTRIGFEKYCEAVLPLINTDSLDERHCLYMARRLKELSLTYDRPLFIGQWQHLMATLRMTKERAFPQDEPETQEATFATLSEESARGGMREWGFLSEAYERWRLQPQGKMLDRQECIFSLYKEAAIAYTQETESPLSYTQLRHTMKFARNCALLHRRLMPDLFQILSAAKGCVDHNYAYEVWRVATDYAHLKNIDNLPALDLSVEELWGSPKKIHFHLKKRSRKGQMRYFSPSSFSLCSYPPEDLLIENFAAFLKKKSRTMQQERAARSLPFTTSLEEGIDWRESMRHWHERKVFVKKANPLFSQASSLVLIFDEDPEGDFPWCMTWLGEHSQESDMAFYSTSLHDKIVGPGISRCTYGGLMMSSPPRRLHDIWNDPDYEGFDNKAEVLLMAAIEYATTPLVVYAAKKPPSPALKALGARFSKKILFLPLSQLSPPHLERMRVFHVLDGYEGREIAGDFIF